MKRYNLLEAQAREDAMWARFTGWRLLGNRIEARMTRTAYFAFLILDADSWDYLSEWEEWKTLPFAEAFGIALEIGKKEQ